MPGVLPLQNQDAFLFCRNTFSYTNIYLSNITLLTILVLFESYIYSNLKSLINV